MICPNCNAQVSDTQAFCGNCGAQLTPTQAAAQPTTPIDAGYQQPAGSSASTGNPSPYATEQAPYGGSSQQSAYGAPYQPQGAANPYGQSPYPPGNYTQPPQQKASDTPFGLSIAGLVCALIGLFPLGFIFAIVALVMNSKQQKSGIYSTKQTPTKVMGIIGLVMSILWTVLTLVFGVALVAAINDGAFDDLDVTTSPSGSSVTITTPSGTSVNLNSDGSVSTSSASSGSSSTAKPSGNSATTSSGGAAATTGNLASGASAAATSSNVIVGEWELESGSDQDLDAGTIDSMREMGFNIVLFVNDDGTFELSLFGESTNGTWSETGTNTYSFTIDGESIMGKYDNSSKRLTWEEDGDQLIFRPLE